MRTLEKFLACIKKRACACAGYTLLVKPWSESNTK